MRALRGCMSSIYALCIYSSGTASVVEYEQLAPWANDAGRHTTVDFSEYPDNTVITTQYQKLGVTFTDGTDRITFNANAFPNDGVGLRGVIDTIHIAFAQPMHHIAVEFPGSMQIQLYWNGRLTYTSSDFLHVGAGFFAGLICEDPFDAVILLDPFGNVNIDDLHFGPPIPAPGALAMLAISLCSCPRRRRDC